MLTDTKKSPYAKVYPLESTAVRWTGGFWKEVEDTVFSATVPELKEMFDSPDISHVVENFRIAAGEKDGDFAGTVFGDGDFYKWLEAAMYRAVKIGDSRLIEEIDSYIDLIGRAQQADGYLSTKQIIGERSGNGVHRMGDINDFEVYNFGHLFTAAALYYRLTGKKNLLAIASKTADYLGGMYDRAERQGEVQTAVCPSHYMGLIELYRATGEEKYLTLARRAIALRDSVKNGLDDNQDRLPLPEHRQIHGHAVRANYLYAGLSDLYLEDGKEEYRTVLDHVWRDLLSHKIYITGGCGALYNGASPYGNFMNHQLIHQAYGYAYQLPNVTAYNETCANVGLVMWAYRMFLAQPKAEYFDVIERVMLNTNLAAVSLDGLRFFYENMLERDRKLEYELIWPLHRTNYITSYCCPPNLARALCEGTEYIYTRTGDTVYTGLYGACEAALSLDAAEFVLKQETAYPYDGTIVFSARDVKKDGPFRLALRIPVWAREGTIQLKDGGKAETIHLTSADAGSYRIVSISSAADFTLRLDLPMEARLTAANPMVEEDRGKTAVERGPLVYCMETADCPPDISSLHQLAVSADAVFSPEMVRIGDREVMALKGTMKTLSKAPEDRLYYRLEAGEGKRVPVRLIPYFAWDNRSGEADENDGPDDEMLVWFPVAY